MFCPHFLVVSGSYHFQVVFIIQENVANAIVFRFVLTKIQLYCDFENTSKSRTIKYK